MVAIVEQNGNSSHRNRVHIEVHIGVLVQDLRMAQEAQESHLGVSPPPWESVVKSGSHGHHVEDCLGGGGEVAGSEGDISWNEYIRSC